MERAAILVGQQGGYAMIVPISFQFSNKLGIARKKIAELLPQRWVSSYTRRPTSLFDSGIGVRSSIIVGRTDLKRKKMKPFLATTEFRRWRKESRIHLFDTSQYAVVDLGDSKRSWPRIGHPNIKELYEALVTNSYEIGGVVKKTGPAVGYKQTAMYYLSVHIDSPPAWTKDGQCIEQSKEGWLRFESEEIRDIVFVLLSGRLAYWWWMANGDGFDLTSGILKSFPIAPEQVREIYPQLLGVARSLREEQPRHPSVTRSAGKVIGTYNLRRCRYLTDQAEQLILDTLKVGHLWPAVLLADARAQKATGKGATTAHEWPFPWVWQGQLVQPDHWL